MSGDSKLVSTLSLTKLYWQNPVSAFDMDIIQKLNEHEIIIHKSSAHGDGIFAFKTFYEGDLILPVGAATLSNIDVIERVCPE